MEWPVYLHFEESDDMSAEEDRSTKNQVFSQRPAGVDPAIQQVSSYEAAKSDFGLDIPVEIVPLPSNGRVYPVGTSLHGKDCIEIRAMTAREEDILTSKALLKKGTVISELIKSCLVDKSVDPATLTAGDRNALMVAIRVTGYGPEYDAEVVCSNDECEAKAARQFNLGELEIQRLAISPVQEGLNLFEFKLPHLKKTIRFKFLTGADEEDISATQEKQKKLGLSSANAVTSNLMHVIVAIDGIEDRAKIAQFVRMMPARDSLELRNYIKENEPGIKMKQTVTCPVCAHEEEVAIPIGVNFLWPSAGR